MTEEELNTLIAQAKVRYDALTPEQRAIHDRDQMRSFVRGQIGIDYPDSEFPRIKERVEKLLGKDGT